MGVCSAYMETFHEMMRFRRIVLQCDQVGCRLLDLPEVPCCSVTHGCKVLAHSYCAV